MSLRDRSLGWYVLHIFHNCVAHPLLVPAELCDRMGMSKVADVLCALHDVTVPDGDPKNVVRLRNRTR